MKKSIGNINIIKYAYTYIHTYIHTGLTPKNNTQKRGGTTYYLSVSPIYLLISKVRRLQARADNKTTLAQNKYE